MYITQLTKYQKLILAGLFLAFLIIGYSFHDDYGIAWDEPAQLEIGKINYDYLLGKSDTVATHHDRFYGAAFEMPIYALQKAIQFNESASIFNFRHLKVHLLFIISLGFFFALLFKLFRNYNAAILGMVMLYIHPRIFAHSFFNSKDIVFMSVFIIGLFTLFLLLEKQTKKRILLHALLSAILIDIRIIGIILPAISFLMIIPILFKRDEDNKQILKVISIYSLATIILIYAFWPALWTDPLLLGKSFARMSHFPFRYDVLFQGQMIPATQAPWNYIPIWIGISTPPFILLLSIIGFIWVFINYFRNPEQVFDSKNKWFILVLVSFPIDFIILLIIINSSLYDGWRQVYFLYPLLILSAVYAYVMLMKTLQTKKIGRGIINGLIIVFMLLTVMKIYKLHPYEQVYFNHLVNKTEENRRKSFEMDYWGLSYSEGLRFILRNDTSSQIKICFANAAGPINILSLLEVQQKRIIIVEKAEQSNYYITNYRYHPEGYKYKNEVFKIVRDQNRILSVFKLDNN